MDENINKMTVSTCYLFHGDELHAYEGETQVIHALGAQISGETSSLPTIVRSQIKTLM